MLGAAAPKGAAASGQDEALLQLDRTSNKNHNSAAIIQRYWRGYQVRKALDKLDFCAPPTHNQQTQNGDRLQESRDFLHPGDIQQPISPQQTDCTPDVWNATSGMLIRNRGALLAAHSEG
jgi:hypothetical protein